MTKILFVGVGNMGGAILSAALERKILTAKEIFILDKSGERADFFAQKYGCSTGNPGDADVIFLAVKPQIFPEIFPIASAKNPLVISVMAGISLDQIAKKSGSTRICRTMPNTPALVGKGITGMIFSPEISESDRTFCQKLFGGIGEIVEVQKEEQMHAITALSGSGPAYFFRFVECLANAGKNLGLSEKMAQELALQTFFGSAELLEKSRESPEELRKKVTSPKGTTFSALEEWENLGFEQIIEKAVFSAEKRSRELGEK